MLLRPNDPETVFRHTWEEAIKHAHCMHCHEKITGGAFIMWHGTFEGGSSAFYLHPECAIDFTLRLLRDVYRYGPVTRKPQGLTPIFAGDEKAALRCALTEEWLDSLRGKDSSDAEIE